MTARNTRSTPAPHPLAENVLALLALDYTRGQIADELDVSTTVVRRIIGQECERHATDVAGLRRMGLDDEAEEA